MIGIYDRKILMLVNGYWNDTKIIFEMLPENTKSKWTVEDIHEHFGDNGFDYHELYRLSLMTRVTNISNNNDVNEDKHEKQERNFQTILMRLYADGYIEDKENQLFITDRGVLAATDSNWLKTIFRENKEWLLSLIIAVLAFIVSIISLIFSVC